MGRGSGTGGVRPHRRGIQLTIYYRAKRLRPTLDLPATAPNLRYARRLLDEIRQKIRLGTFSYETYFPDAKNASEYVPAPQTFGERADRWLETLKVEHSTRIGYQRTLDRYWRPKFGDVHLTAIRPTDIREVLAPLAAKTMNNTLIPLRRILAAAMDDGVIKENPALRIHNAKVQTEPPDPLTMDEVELVLADLATRVDPQTANYFEVAFFTGLRPSEQIALHWLDYARKEGRLRVHRARVWGKDKPRTKTHQARDIELLDRAAAAIERQRKHTLLAGGEIFWNPNTGEPWNDEQVQRRYWNASLMRLGLRHREAYQTRHTFATIGLMAGCNPAWVARQMGHRSLKMFFEVYARWIDGADKGTQKALIDAKTATKTATKGPR